MTESELWRIYKNRPLSCMKLKTEEDELTVVYPKEDQSGLDVFLITHQGMSSRYPLADVPVVGAKAVEMGSMGLENGDRTVNGLLVLANGDTPTIIVTQRGAVKRILVREISRISRVKWGVTVTRELKKSLHRIIYMPRGKSKEITLMNQRRQQITIDPTDFPIGDRISNDPFVMDEKKGGKATEVIDAPEIPIES